jgi:protein-L-isoaspartate O-methyltransferase
VSQNYVGSELELFAAARNWKSYVAASLLPFMGPRVLEVGAGIGANVPALFSGPVREWVALEPDANQARQISEAVVAGKLPPATRTVTGTLQTLDDTQPFDAILYIDVVEHIERDADELRLATQRLAPGGRLIVLVPAHQFLFSPFDAAIGHYRRYSRATLRAIAPPDCRLEMLRMLDSVGFFAALANRAVLRASMPTPRQIQVWDRLMVPLSRLLDPLTAYSFGKSIVAIWSR